MLNDYHTGRYSPIESNVGLSEDVLTWMEKFVLHMPQNPLPQTLLQLQEATLHSFGQ